MNLTKLLQLKNIDENLYLDDIILESLKKYFKINPNKNIKKKLFINKNDINNKINFILNKISESNIDNLILEFINNINLKNINCIIIYFNNIFQKCLKEKNFIEYYLDFFFKLNFIICNENFFKIDIFINLLEEYTKSLYILNKDINEDNRYNFLILINNLYKKNFFKQTFLNYFENILFNQNFYKIDIYYWIKFQNNNKKYKNIIEKYINETSNRDNILFKSLNDNPIDKKQNNINIIVNTNINRINIEIINILEEYVHLKIDDEIIQYLKENFKTLEQKVLFIDIFIKFLNNNNNIDIFINLIKKLLKNKILFKSSFTNTKNIPNQIKYLL